MSPRINFARGVPAEAAFPRDQIALCAQALSRSNDPAAFQYGPASGPVRLREWVAGHHDVDTAEVMVGNGSVALFDLLCRTWLEHGRLKPGQPVLVEAPCYDRVLHLLRSHGAHVIPVPVDADGPDIAAIEAGCAGRPALFYCVPDFQNPSGAVYPAEKRHAVIALARAHGFTIIEDSPYRLLRYEGAAEPSFLELAPDVTIQLNSFSKLISPGLRAAYLIAPAPIVAQVARFAEQTYVTPGNFALSLAAEWLHRGHLEPQIAHLRRLYGPRLRSMLAALDSFLPGQRFLRPEGGFFVGLTLSEPVDADLLLAEAGRAGVDLADGSGFFIERPATPFLRLPFGSMDEAIARRGVGILAEVLGRLGTAGRNP
ncbi:MAG: PLP-dependent aminotransferase family protein [Rhizobiales bacterium]|nr:PLP-dependent aminotransferase family protein [Hyphomicrobiales bacterium]